MAAVAAGSMRRRRGATGALLVAVASLARAEPPCDANAGAEVFATKCATCHTALAGQNGPVGPTLFGVVGRRPASIAGFSYSSAMNDRREPWTRASLDWFLFDPPNRIPGTLMAFSGLKNDSARAAVICYLAAQDAAAP
jgi:cytochrome c